MDWLQFGLLIVAMGGMFQWLRADIAANRAEAMADRRHMDAKLDAQLTGMRQECRDFQAAVLHEMKDFHGRLCAIEERNKKPWPHK